MTPGMMGRLQSRLFVVTSFGVIWTAAITPLLPRPAATPLAGAYRMTFESLLVVAVLGLGWELVYHGLQQWRWDKDWPGMFMLAALLPEALSVWLVLHALGWIPGGLRFGSPYRQMFAAHVASTWLVMWSVLHGPIRVLFPCWRHSGGRIMPSHRGWGVLP